MKRPSPLALVLLLTVPVVFIMQTPPAQSDSEKSNSLLRHVVLLKFQDSVSDEKITEVAEAFSELPKKIEEIHDFEWGLENSPESLSKGFTHCFLVTFKSEEDREAYLPHAAHQEFVKLVTPVVADVLVVDYWTGK
ncbi:MAG: Dabb family protein [Planctomycetaceae bacterium]|nr:Dabb family protein [Planctomycetaceae bacterium]